MSVFELTHEPALLQGRHNHAADGGHSLHILLGDVQHIVVVQPAVLEPPDHIPGEPDRNNGLVAFKQKRVGSEGPRVGYDLGDGALLGHNDPVAHSLALRCFPQGKGSLGRGRRSS